MTDKEMDKYQMMLEALKLIRKLPKSHGSVQIMRDIIDELFETMEEKK